VIKRMADENSETFMAKNCQDYYYKKHSPTIKNYY